MAAGHSSNARGAVLALAAYGVFATHDVFVKALGAHYAPFQIIFFSVLFSFPLVTFMLMRDPTSGNLRPRHPWWTALRTLAGVVTGVTAFYAFSVLPLAQVYAILFAAPLLITVLAIPILGERVGAWRSGAVIVGLFGVLVVLRPGATDLSLGHLAALAAAVCGALGSVVVRKIGRDERDAVLLLYPMVANFVLMSFLLPFVYEPMPFAHVGMLGIIAALGFAGGLLVIGAYRAGDAAIVAPMQYSQIIWAAAYGMLLFSEQPDAMTVLGALIIIGSGVFIVMRESRGASSTSPVLQSRLRPETATGPRFTQLRGLPGRAHAPLAKDGASR
ncbi:DMT family transporter [Roseitranquillus sediminis]|uniref:DMT family transporter n=1 Tax=Roseitranquillus sediminis TaxID=2809051 RepID=UPI001D0C5DD1|nr:DMT family transporter [Roseitranquillus sediminis]MBM9596215.1 DMT family transporter [Roseitranquillus sediminis]